MKALRVGLSWPFLLVGSVLAGIGAAILIVSSFIEGQDPEEEAREEEAAKALMRLN